VGINLFVWLVSLVAVVPLLARLASLHGNGRVRATENSSEEEWEASGSMMVGLFVGDAMVIVPIAAVVVFVLAASTGVLNLRELQRTPAAGSAGTASGLIEEAPQHLGSSGGIGVGDVEVG